ncbi:MULTISPECIES: ArsR/SmtB family transcription factor [Brevibacillus]|uniref:ArsR/SmtB family transcription factor n=1 Tax=Brevibacillus TaxID=55080 RepID=UPI0025B64411|nr:metalloregulator ArsR/SmtB family transcription factor [Brevibacillus agri]MDN4094575.1 metalloregulator ArsR/SmtB family transcription factor [Brevibacillus agri]MED3500547.1 metalloregulator ArsR/SmtB family transcription factor [Brevibacillus agri]
MDIHQLADCLKALGDPTRLKIIALLNLRDFCVCELIPIFNISQPAVSKHLNRLKTSGLVTENRRGQWVFYSLNRKKLEEIGYGLNHLPDFSTEIEELDKQGLLVKCD